MLRRLEAVAGLRKKMTERHRRRFRSNGGGAFEPWEESSIEEGAVIKSARNSTLAATLTLFVAARAVRPF